MNADRRMISAGDDWRQPRLSDTLAKIRTPRYLDGNAPAWFAPRPNAVDVSLAPGTTGFSVADDAGVAVACAITMGRPFGLGGMVREGGYLFAASSLEEGRLEQLALGFLACIKGTGQTDRDAPRCPAPAATFSIMP